MQEIAELIWENPHIFRIRIPLPSNPLKNVNVYVLRSQGQSLVIDTGFDRPECREVLWAGMKELDLDLSDTVLYLTHFHADHIGLVWDFVERGVPVYMGRKEYEYYDILTSDRIVRELNSVFIKEGLPKEQLMNHIAGRKTGSDVPKPGFPVIAVEDGQGLLIGDTIVRIIEVPGHTPGNTVLYLPDEQILFSGDHILFDITPNISVWPKVPHSLSDYLTSLHKIRPLSVRRTFPAHREAGEGINARIEELLGHHRSRLDEICHTVEAHPGITAYEAAGLIRWSMRGRAWEEVSEDQRWFAMSETLAHLYELVKNGKLLRKEQGSRISYYRTR